MQFQVPVLHISQGLTEINLAENVTKYAPADGTADRPSGGSSRELCIIIDKETVKLTGQLGDLYNKYDMTAVDLPADGTGQLTVLRPPP